MHWIISAAGLAILFLVAWGTGGARRMTGDARIPNVRRAEA